MFSSVKQQWVLILASSVALVNFFQCGLVIGWSSPVLARLQGPNSPIPVTSAEGSWIASIVVLVSFVCSPLAALVLHYLGRKSSLALAALPFTISWVITAFATNTTHLLVARGIAGIGTCLSFTVIPVYLGEIAPDNIRGGIIITKTVISNVGILVIYYIGTFPQFWISSLISALPLLAFFAFYTWLPESPYFLYEKGRKEEAIAEFKRIRNSDNVDNEIKIMEAVISQKNAASTNRFIEIIKETHHRRALFICLGVITFAQFTGGITFLLYAHLIFQKAGSDPNVMSMIKASLQLLTSIGSAYVVDNIGKRPLLIGSCIGSAFFMACEGIYFFLLDGGHNVDSIWWLPLAAMILFNVSHTLGLSSISTAYIGELFHPNVKSIAVCIAKAYLSISVFIVGIFFEVITDAFGSCVPFFIFSIIGVLGLFFVIFFVPETKGRSFEEIQYYMKHKTYEINKENT